MDLPSSGARQAELVIVARTVSDREAASAFA
jgi:hypothetical protein